MLIYSMIYKNSGQAIMVLLFGSDPIPLILPMRRHGNRTRNFLNAFRRFSIETCGAPPFLARLQTPGLSRRQAHISVWIVLLSALTIIPRFLCFYVVSPTNGIASFETCETSAQTTLGWMCKPVIGFEPMSDGYKPPALPIELYRRVRSFFT